MMIEHRNVVVVGQGYVGLPLSIEASLAGFRVTGLELNPKIVEQLNSGISHIDDVTNKDIEEILSLGFEATSDPSVIASAGVVVICVPTPLGEGGSPDMSAVLSSIEEVGSYIKQGALVVLESTTYPGTTNDLLLPNLEARGKVLDQDFFLAFSPERIDPGNKYFSLKNTPKVVGGVSEKSTSLAVRFYESFIDTVIAVKSAREAETTKLLENTYRHVNIALVNEMSRFCAEMKIDLWEVIRAASSKPFGFQAFYPGPGVGGHCIPIDPNYLSYEVKKQLGYPFRFVELAQEINTNMPRYIVDRVQDLLNAEMKSIKGSSVLLLGVSYKANISDTRESPASTVASLLIDKGALLTYHDPRVPEWHVGGNSFKAVESLDSACIEADLVILLQPHKEYDLDALVEGSNLFFDTRGVTSSSRAIRL